MALSERTVCMTYYHSASVKECLIIIQRKVRKTKKVSRKWYAFVRGMVVLTSPISGGRTLKKGLLLRMMPLSLLRYAPGM